MIKGKYLIIPLDLLNTGSNFLLFSWKEKTKTQRLCLKQWQNTSFSVKMWNSNLQQQILITIISLLTFWNEPTSLIFLSSSANVLLIKIAQQQFGETESPYIKKKKIDSFLCMRCISPHTLHLGFGSDPCCNLIWILEMCFTLDLITKDPSTFVNRTLMAGLWLRGKRRLSCSGCWQFTLSLSLFFLECNCLTMVCMFLLYSKVNQLYVSIYLPFFGFPSHSGHHRALSRVPCAIK